MRRLRWSPQAGASSPSSRPHTLLKRGVNHDGERIGSGTTAACPRRRQQYRREVDDLHRLAHDTVAWFLDEWTPRPDDYAALEAAEVVEVDSDGLGVMLLWMQTTYDQGQRKFGS